MQTTFSVQKLSGMTRIKYKMGVLLCQLTTLQVSFWLYHRVKIPKCYMISKWHILKVLTLAVLNLLLSFFENTVGSDQLASDKAI